MQKGLIKYISFMIPVIYTVIYSDEANIITHPGITLIISLIIIKILKYNKAIEENYSKFLFNIGLINIIAVLLLYNNDVVKLMQENKNIVINTAVLILILIVEAKTNNIINREIKNEYLTFEQVKNKIDDKIIGNNKKKEIKKAKIYGILFGIIILLVININIIYKSTALLLLLIIISTPGNAH